MTNKQNRATAISHPNLAFIKYWGNRDDYLRLPVNSSVSMNLNGLQTQTTVEWAENLEGDTLILNGNYETGRALERVSAHLDVIRERLNLSMRASVFSANNFPMGTGIASSASSFAALTVAAVAAAGAELTERELTTLARRGSGSASRSVPSGFVRWYKGNSHETSYAESIAAPDYWDVVDVIAVVSGQHKAVGSTEGHQSANTSDLQAARVSGADERLRVCCEAILARDFASFAEVVEMDSNLMHAVMMTSRPPLFYWLPATLAIMEQVQRWRAYGLQVCYTLDAGPNVHCICIRKDAEQVKDGLKVLSGVLNVLTAPPGGPSKIIENPTE
jgi:diphosphomevalonate decarboxylase